MGKGHRKRTRKVARSARGIQTILGGHQDSVVARTLLGKLGADSQISGASGFTFGRLHAREENLAAAAEADFLKAWRKFPTPRDRRAAGAAAPGRAAGGQPCERAASLPIALSLSCSSSARGVS